MVGAVHLVQVDVIGAESAQAVLDLTHDPLPRAPLVRVFAHRHAELGGNDEVIPVSLDGPGDDFLGLAAGVDVGGVGDVDARVDNLARIVVARPPPG